jgi:DNA-binding SARP family transcriptional activator
MLTLAVLKHARSVVLLELLWGEDAIDSGTQALKMLVSRARAQLGDPGIIVASRGGYALRDDVIVDFEETERLLRSLSMRQALTDSQRQELVLGYEQFKDSWSRMPSAVNPSVEAAIATTRHRVIERLGKDALERGEVGFVHDLANELRHYDQSDEAAYELEVSAFLQAGNYASAIREYRRYSEHLMQHLGVKPAISMEELMRRNEAHEKTLKRVAES